MSNTPDLSELDIPILPTCSENLSEAEVWSNGDLASKGGNAPSAERSACQGLVGYHQAHTSFPLENECNLILARLEQTSSGWQACWLKVDRRLAARYQQGDGSIFLIKKWGGGVEVLDLNITFPQPVMLQCRVNTHPKEPRNGPTQRVRKQQILPPHPH